MKHRSHFLPTVVLTTILLLTSACKDHIDQLVGTKWTLQSIITQHGQVLLPQDYYTMEISEDQINLKLDVNHCGLSWKAVEGSVIEIADEGMCTRACCDSEMAKTLMKKLGGQHRVQLEDQRLTLIGRDTIRLRPWSEDDVKRTSESDYLKIRRTGCFGTCPIYEMTLYADGAAQYFGRQFVQVKGDAKHQFDKDDTAKLFQLADRIGFENLPEAYDQPQVSDIESIFIEYNGREVKVRWKKDVPESLLSLIDQMHMKAVEAGWASGEAEK